MQARPVQKIAYTLANPVAAGVVQRAHEWPGDKVLLKDLDRGVLHNDDADAFRQEVAAEVA